MKFIYILVLIVMFSACKDDKREENSFENEAIEENIQLSNENIQIDDVDIETLNKSINIELKQKQLIEKKDESEELEKLILDKHYLVEKKDYTINFNYPLLNESYKPTNRNFNDFINDYYVNITKTEADILESKLLCDSITSKTFREERLIDYKIYNVNDQLISVLFYKENFYSGAMHPSYAFDCFNFDLESGVFMAYEDFFNQGSEEELVEIINETINKEIGKGEMYYECWDISSDDFFVSKNNFVLNETYIEFYFDDCVMCPSYTGVYAIELPLMDLLSVLKKFDSNPLVF
ncbi:DUF3298 domain-containing protein [Winogradskyella forsetii]|uniref:DUF3298 domain-containing protein n=1 Tax=Winogradskyella forsetii TaxID=2686077 RepID=UPI0015BFDFF4|nr:DUF3298 domain-containing protein [Winogradskyella forsetii]